MSCLSRAGWSGGKLSLSNNAFRFPCQDLRRPRNPFGEDRGQPVDRLGNGMQAARFIRRLAPGQRTSTMFGVQPRVSARRLSACFALGDRGGYGAPERLSRRAWCGAPPASCRRATSATPRRCRFGPGRRRGPRRAMLVAGRGCAAENFLLQFVTEMARYFGWSCPGLTPGIRLFGTMDNDGNRVNPRDDD